MWTREEDVTRDRTVTGKIALHAFQGLKDLAEDSTGPSGAQRSSRRRENSRFRSFVILDYDSLMTPNDANLTADIKDPADNLSV